MKSQATAEKIKSTLIEALTVRHIYVKDITERHRRHSGFQEGRGHYELLIAADELDALSALQQHRLIYKHLDELLKHSIHALQITVQRDLS